MIEVVVGMFGLGTGAGEARVPSTSVKTGKRTLTLILRVRMNMHREDKHQK